AAFARFQQALFAHDAPGVRALVTGESAPVADEMPWERIAAQQPLQPVRATDERGRFFVHVRDPNRGGAAGVCVVVRENGRFVVDLVATAALHGTPSGASDRCELVPRELGPEDWERIRQRGLAAPPGQPPR